MKIQSTLFDPIAGLPGWHATSEAIHSSECERLIELALRLQSEALEKKYYCICGFKDYESGYRLYLAPAVGVKSIIEYFEVGSQDGDDLESVFAQIAEANAINPLIPYFADPAGLKAKFSKPVTPKLIEILEQSVINAEIMMDDEEGTIADFVRTNKEIQLWWD